MPAATRGDAGAVAIVVEAPHAPIGHPLPLVSPARHPIVVGDERHRATSAGGRTRRPRYAQPFVKSWTGSGCQRSSALEDARTCRHTCTVATHERGRARHSWRLVWCTVSMVATSHDGVPACHQPPAPAQMGQRRTLLKIGCSVTSTGVLRCA
eukprot:4179626-Prymnesium_polylepis.1